MPTVTTSELIDRAKAAADMRDNFVTPTQWVQWATQERYALDLFIARSGWPMPLQTQTTTMDGVINTLTIEVPAMAVVCVHQYRGGSYRLLKHTNAVDIARSDQQGDPTEYRVFWDSDDLYLVFGPAPTAGTVIKVTYLAHPQKLSLTVSDDENATEVTYPMGWEERIVLGMARRALIKEESDTRSIDSEIALWESRIEEAAWSRVLADVPSVRNTDYNTYGWTDRYSVPPFGNWLFV